jgi:hypothetical protein
MPGILSLQHEKGALDVHDSALIVGIDDTGNDLFRDASHPVFGLGGCAIMARDYFRHLDEPWNVMKDQHFGGRKNELHASKLGHPSKSQLAALEKFFTCLPFFRFAVMTADTLSNTTAETNLHLVSVSVLHQVADFAKWVQPTEIVFIIENSQRIEQDLLKHFSTYRFGNGEIEITPKVMLASKDVCCSPVEVADFVMQAAGAQVRNRLRGFAGVRNIIRKDFAAIFHKVDRRLSGYTELLSAQPPSA